tara:strand:- start:137 stop:748 length:612 start_codon:yes stop_codon:yes gene_type:complete
MGDSLQALAQQFDLANGKLPPVHQWNPSLSGDMDLVIKSNGEWVHEGGLIKRKSLVRLFSSILKKEGDDYFLVTPVEKWRIQVEDRALHVLSLAEGESGICAILSDGHSLALDGGSRLRLSLMADSIAAKTLEPLDSKGVVPEDLSENAEDSSDDAIAEVYVRDGLWARFTRNAWYELVNNMEEGVSGLAVRSGQALIDIEAL